MSHESLVREVHSLRRDVAELSGNVHDLVEAWRTAHGVVRFVKWMGGMATAGTALWALIQLAWATRK
ncbi:MAG: hypothetical protein ABS82_00210 [Rhodanobacter sp. SCN 67-45]|nr:MAG: hypothetical protein ABS82_00210 [Rhodanobacter sp. SCN 67-45]